MSDLEALFDRVFNRMRDRFDSRDNPVSQEELDKKNSAPKESSLVVSTEPGRSVPAVSAPNVKPPTNSRRAKREAEAEQMRQWRMVQIARRTAPAIDSASAVAAYAFHRADDMQNAIADSFYRDKRHEPMNELMKMFA